MDSLFYMVLTQWLILLQLLVLCFKNLNKLVVLTGSQLPIGVHRTDAKEKNLITLENCR